MAIYHYTALSTYALTMHVASCRFVADKQPQGTAKYLLALAGDVPFVFGYSGTKIV